MVEINLSTPELTVLGGPAEIKLDTNFGPAGSRGNFVLYGLLNPNDPAAASTFITEPIIFDLYILTDPSSPDYLQVFSYANQDGIPQWIPTIKLTPNFYGTNRVLTFISGTAELEINVFELGLVNLRNEIPTLDGTRFFFSVQATLSNFELLSEINEMVPENHFPAAISVRVDDIFLDPTDEELKIPLTFKGAEFNGTGWQNINNKNVIVNLSILVVNPNDVLDILNGDS
jgi:hypothetical protein